MADTAIETGAWRADPLIWGRPAALAIATVASVALSVSRWPVRVGLVL